MTENDLKSKLKRKRFVVGDQQAERASREALNTTNPPSGGRTGQSGRSVVPAAEWWSREQLPNVDSLWALTLQSALPQLKNQHRYLVPELPLLSTQRPSAEKQDDQWLCDLSEELSSLPEMPQFPLSPHPVKLDSSQQAEPAAEPPDEQLCCFSQESQNGMLTPCQSPTKRPRPSFHGREGAAAAPDGRVSLQERGTSEEEEEKEEVQRSVRGGGGRQSCPMCLLVFPLGFTQMDCDGHLAQCLSEVNVDVTW